MILTRPVILTLLSSLMLVGCSAPERHEITWKTVHLTGDSQVQIDDSRIALHSGGQLDEATRAKVIAAGFTLTPAPDADVLRTVAQRTDGGRDGFSKDLLRLATLVEPRALRLIVVTEPPTQRLELNDGLLITPKDPARLAAILARHHLQEPVTVAGITCRAVTQPRGDLLGLDQRLVALRADADVASVEADISSIPTHK